MNKQIKSKRDVKEMLSDITGQLIDYANKLSRRVDDGSGYQLLSKVTELVVSVTEGLNAESKTETYNCFEHSFDLLDELKEGVLTPVFYRTVKFEEVYFLLRQVNDFQTVLHQKIVALTLVKELES
jgi:hypothetical protein